MLKLLNWVLLSCSIDTPYPSWRLVGSGVNLGIADRLYVQRLGTLVDRLTQILRCIAIDKLNVDSQSGKRCFELVVGSAIEIAGGKEPTKGKLIPKRLIHYISQGFPGAIAVEVVEKEADRPFSNLGRESRAVGCDKDIGQRPEWTFCW